MKTIFIFMLSLLVTVAQEQGNLDEKPVREIENKNDQPYVIDNVKISGVIVSCMIHQKGEEMWTTMNIYGSEKRMQEFLNLNVNSCGQECSYDVVSKSVFNIWTLID